MQDGLMETFGITASGTYLDILWIAESGSEVVIRLAEKSVHEYDIFFLPPVTQIDIRDAPKVMAAVVITPASPRISTIRQTNFLPSFALS